MIYTKQKGGVFVYHGRAHRRGLRCPGDIGHGQRCGEQISGAKLDPRRVRILGFEQKLVAGPYCRIPAIITTVYCMGCLSVWRSRSRWLGELVKEAQKDNPRAELFRLPNPKKAGRRKW